MYMIMATLQEQYGLQPSLPLFLVDHHRSMLFIFSTLFLSAEFILMGILGTLQVPVHQEKEHHHHDQNKKNKPKKSVGCFG